MSIKRNLSAIAIALFVSSVSYAQAVQVQSSPSQATQGKKQTQKSPGTTGTPNGTVRPDSVAIPAGLPEGAASWVVQIVTGGGFTGADNNSLTVTSAGSLTCRSSMAKPLLPMDAQSLSQLISSVKPSTPPLQTTVSMCSDCAQTSVMITRRESDRSVKTIVATWDETTKKRVPNDILRLYEMVLTLTDCIH